MINDINVANALVHLYDTFNSDDHESPNELAIIEAHVKQLEYKCNDIVLAEDALYLHCFATEVLKQLPEGTGDLFGIGEDHFIMGLFPFAQLIAKTKGEAVDDKKYFAGTFVYDCMEELAGLWIATVMRQQIEICAAMAYEMPELDEYELDVVRVVNSHIQ